MGSKKFSDRHDGTRLKISGFEKIWNGMKSKRSENEVHILREIDVTELKKYYESKKKDNDKFTYFHLFATAISKVLKKDLSFSQKENIIEMR